MQVLENSNRLLENVVLQFRRWEMAVLIVTILKVEAFFFGISEFLGWGKFGSFRVV